MIKIKANIWYIIDDKKYQALFDQNIYQLPIQFWYISKGPTKSIFITKDTKIKELTKEEYPEYYI